MTSRRVSDPPRWRDGDGVDANALAARAAALADAARPSLPLDAQALSRIRIEVRARRTRVGRSALALLPLRWKLLWTVAVLIVCVTTAGGARALWRRYVAAAGRTALPHAEEATTQHRPRRPARASLRAGDAPALPVASDESPAQPEQAAPTVDAPEGAATNVAPAPARMPEARDAREVQQHASGGAETAGLPGSSPQPSRAAVGPLRPEASRDRGPSPPHVPPPFATSEPPARLPQPSATEAALLAEALTELRQRQDARAALAVLDRYARAFPHGVLETEALRTRVEAVVQIGDLKTALKLLDRAAGADVLGADLLLTRAELRAEAGRFRDALVDFTDVVDGRMGPLAAGGDQRALYGRAVCLGRLAQHERARSALRAYRDRFPQGRFADEVERLLAVPASTRP